MNKTAYFNTPNFVFTVWLTGKTPVKDEVVAGQPFVMSARADQANKTSPLNDTRLITIFFTNSLVSPITNDSDGLPANGVITLCQDGDCSCQPSPVNNAQQCAIYYNIVNDNSQYFWSKVNNTFEFPIAGDFAPSISFFTVSPLNKTDLIAVAFPAQLGSVTIDVQAPSASQTAYVGNANVILSIAVFVLTFIETYEAIPKIVRSTFLKKKPDQPVQASQSQPDRQQSEAHAGENWNERTPRDDSQKREKARSEPPKTMLS